KTMFDKQVLKQHSGEIIFSKGQLVQVYRNNLNYTFKTEYKILPRWSEPHRVTEHLRNSYRLETLSGIPLAGEFSTRRLRTFNLRIGTQLDQQQRDYIVQMKEA
ncbi:hypothetical protein HD554DRAFT_2030988, partial [Boletus coccyginus]